MPDRSIVVWGMISGITAVFPLREVPCFARIQLEKLVVALADDQDLAAWWNRFADQRANTVDGLLIAQVFSRRRRLRLQPRRKPRLGIYCIAGEPGRECHADLLVAAEQLIMSVNQHL